MEIDEEANQKNGVLTKSELLSEETMCRLPENYGEIALTDMQADYLYRYGYYNTENKEEVLFSSFDEIIGVHLFGVLVDLYPVLSRLVLFDQVVHPHVLPVENQPDV